MYLCQQKTYKTSKDMKKKTFLFMLITAVMTILTACSQDNLEDYYNNWANSNGGANAGGGSGSATAGRAVQVIR